VLEGALSSEKSKKGYVVDLFPPGNDGSEKSKKGYIVNMFPPGNDGTRPKNTVGTGSGDSKSGAVDHNSSRSNRGGVRDTGGDSDLSDADIRECEHCGASCTERCRCKPTGLDLIFGHTEDSLFAMESDADGSYLAFETCYGMRSVTLTSMGKDLNLTLVIAKGWRAESRGR
jgi:hypothetical protein